MTGLLRLLAAASMAAAMPTPVFAQEVRIDQSGRDGLVDIIQVGEGSARVVQGGAASSLHLSQTGRQSADLRQVGRSLDAQVLQSGAAGNAVTLDQRGERGRIVVAQQGLSGAGVATLMQSGRDNAMRLDQSGAANHAALTQIGDGNTMTARQSGAGNALVWSQIGEHLPDLRIEQTGAMHALIEQRGGR